MGAARATVKGRAAGAMRWLALTEDGDGPIVDLMGPIEFEFEFAFELWALVDEIDEIRFTKSPAPLRPSHSHLAMTTPGSPTPRRRYPPKTNQLKLRYDVLSEK